MSRPEQQQVTLIDETGAERQFRIHDAFELESVAYYLVEDVSDPDRVLLLRESDGRLETVDGEEFDRVMKAIEADEIE